MNRMMGKQSIAFGHPVSILATGSIVGPKEGEGPLGDCFDIIGEDPMFGCESWEEAESTLQKEAVLCALNKAGKKTEDIRMIYAGDLLAQSTASCFGLEELNIPLYGLFGACSTMGESLALASMAVDGGYAQAVLAVTSSHFGSAEKEFRFPLEYGNQRPLSASWTVTAGAACVLGTDAGVVGVTGVTTGRIVDSGLKDSQNMGACMAPAACDTIYRTMRDFECDPETYDKIITGDLGVIGSRILCDLLGQRGYDIRERHIDCGKVIYDQDTQDTHAGGSGCGCAGSVFASAIWPRLESGEWQRVLFVPTGALMSKVSFAEGQSVPGIAQAVVVEHIGGKQE